MQNSSGAGIALFLPLHGYILCHMEGVRTDSPQVTIDWCLLKNRFPGSVYGTDKHYIIVSFTSRKLLEQMTDTYTLNYV